MSEKNELQRSETSKPTPDPIETKIQGDYTMEDKFIQKVNQLTKEADGYIQTISDAQDALASVEQELCEVLDDHAAAEE